jgi:uncharacterized protein YcnI
VALAAAGVAMAAVVLPAAPAAAHVTVAAENAVAGERARVTFRMPNEGETPSIRLEVHLQPEDAPPIPSALIIPLPGWSAEVTYEELAEPIQGAHGEELTEAASVIVWTADDPESGIQPGEVGEFPALIGPLPEAEELYFPALQSYEGVEEPVRWISRPDPGGAEPPDPAPVLRVAPAGDSAADVSPSDTPAPAASADEPAGESSAGVWLGLAGLIAGLAGVALGGVAFMRTRS